MLLHRLIALAHQGADGGRGGVEGVDLVLVDNLPEPVRSRPGRHALEHQRDGAVRERSVDDIGVARDPADIGRAPVDVARLVVEDVFMRHRGPDHVATGRVQHALGLPGRTGGVEDEERVFGAHRFGLAIGRLCGHQLGIVDIARGIPGDIGTGAAHHDDAVDIAGAGQRLVDIGLQRDGAAAAQAFIRGDDETALAIGDAAGQGVGRKATEDDGMHRTDPGAGEHRVSRFRDHRHVDGDPVALLDTQGFQAIGEAADLLVQFAIGDGPGDVRIIAFPDDGGVIGFFRQVAVDAVGGSIEPAIAEPADVEIILVPADIGDFGERGDPVDSPRLLAPESVRILDRLAVFLVIARLGHTGAGGPVCGNRINSVRIGVGHQYLPFDVGRDRNDSDSASAGNQTNPGDAAPLPQRGSTPSARSVVSGSSVRIAA